jgi:hypothetical protein
MFLLLLRLAMVAIKQVLARKQTGYGAVIAWLEEETGKLSGLKKGLEVEVLVGVAKEQSGQNKRGKQKGNRGCSG